MHAVTREQRKVEQQNKEKRLLSTGEMGLHRLKVDRSSIGAVHKGLKVGGHTHGRGAIQRGRIRVKE